MSARSAIPLKLWPIREQPRHRLQLQGSEVLTDAELLALVVGASGRGSGGVLETCRGLLARFGGLEALGRCRPRELMQVPGIGLARACALAAVIELARRIQSGPPDPAGIIRCSSDVYRWIKPRLTLLDHELFLALALDGKNRVQAVHQVARGSTTSVEVHPREVFGPCVREAAAAVIVAHNHPSGDPDPSADDRQLTERLKQAGEVLGIPLLDHLVVGRQRYVSFADRGLI